MTNLTPENAHHQITWSDNKEYFADSYSTVDSPPVSVVRSLDGEVVMELEEADHQQAKRNWLAGP